MKNFSITDPADWPSALAKVRAQMGEPLNVHRFLANYPSWLTQWWGFRNHVIHGTTLSARQYELVVLRVATLCDAPYEWEHHVVTGKERGLDDTDFESIRSGPSASQWDAPDRALLAAVDDCIAERKISTASLQALSKNFTDEQILDIVATVVMYHAMAIVTRSFDIPIDEEKPSFAVESFDTQSPA